jgi:hypothetical protein
MSDPPAQPANRSARDLLGGRWILVAALLLALVPRARGLGEWWLNPDEGIYYSILTRQAFAGFWTEVTANAHPPLYYLILRGLGYLTWDFVGLRAFSVVCGLGAVAAVWAAARELTRQAHGAGHGNPTRGLDASARALDPSARGLDARARGLDARARGLDLGVSGAIAGLLVALSPGAIEMSQVMRPYMLQLALLAGGLWLLLRYRRAPSRRDLGWYVLLVSLALLTHYSSVLALGVFAGLVAVDGVERGLGRREWRLLAAAHLVPAAVVVTLYVVHLRPLGARAPADDALNGWLSFYMIDSPSGAWLSFLGYQSLVAIGWLRGPLALLLLAVPVVALARRDRIPAALTVGTFAVAIAAAAVDAYPLGSTRHSTWLIAFTAPVLGWLGSLVTRMAPKGALAVTAAVAALFAAGGPVGSALGADRAPWAPTDQVLTRADMSRMIDLVDPSAEPELLVMSAQTFYLLLPFFPGERELAVFSADSTLFHFPYGERRVLVSQSWDFTAGPDPRVADHLARALARANRAFPELSLDARDEAVLLVGGWRPPLVDELTSPSLSEPVTAGERVVPGFFGFLLDLPGLRRVFEVESDR